MLLLFVHPVKKARLFAAILMGIAFLGVLAAIPSLRMFLVHLTASGPGLVILGGGALGALVWCILEFLVRRHKVAAFGRKGEGHQLRPAHGCQIPRGAEDRPGQPAARIVRNPE